MLPDMAPPDLRARFKALNGVIDDFLARRDWKRALELSKDLIALDPQRPEGHAQLGRCLIGLGKNLPAQKAVEEALARAPEDSWLHFLHAIALRNRNLLKLASRAIRRAQELDPDVAEYWMESAWQWDKWGDPGKAREFATRALECNPRHAEALAYLSRTLPSLKPTMPRKIALALEAL